MSLTSLQFAILDALADDIENVEQVYLLANRFYLGEKRGDPRFLLRDIVDEMLHMIEEGYIEVRASDDQAKVRLDSLNPAAIHYYWFGYTAKGRQEWDAYPSEERLPNEPESP